MNSEITIFLADNYTSEKAEFLGNVLDNISKVSTLDEHGMLSIIRDHNDISMASKPDIFLGLITDICISISNEIGISTSSGDLLLLSKIVEFYSLSQTSPDFIQDDRFLTSNLDRKEVVAEMIASYTDADKDDMFEIITHVSHSLINNLHERAKEMLETFEDLPVEYSPAKIEFMFGIVGAIGSSVIELVLSGSNLEGRESSLVDLKTDEIKAHCEDSPEAGATLLCSIWLAVELATKEPDELDRDKFGVLCRNWWETNFKTDGSRFSMAGRKLIPKGDLK